MGRKRDELAFAIAEAMTVQYHLERQREKYHEGCFARGEGEEHRRLAAYHCGKAEVSYAAVRMTGEHVGPEPPIPYVPPNTSADGFWVMHDPDDWRQWDDVPEEFEGCEWRRSFGVWRPERRDQNDIPKRVEQPRTGTPDGR